MLLERQNDQTKRLDEPEDFNLCECDEEYLPDDRVAQTPSEFVQNKLMGMLPRGMAMPVSFIHTDRDVRR